MKIHRLALLLLSVLLFGMMPGQAQEMTNQVSSSSDFSVRYPDNWISYIDNPYEIRLERDDGWFIDLKADEAVIVRLRNTDPYLDARSALAGLSGTQTGPINLERLLELPMQSGLGYQASTTLTVDGRTGVPVEIIAFNAVDDGRIVVAMLYNAMTFEAINAGVLAEFQNIIETVRMDGTTDDAGADPDVFIPEGAVRIADLEPGTLRFEGGISMIYPEGWIIQSDQPYIRKSVSLIYGESLFNYDAFIAVTINDSADFPIDLFRESLMGMTAMLYTGQDDYDPERDLITETLEDGRIVQYLDTSQAEAFYGNSILVEFDARYWVSILFSVVVLDEENRTRGEEVLEMARSLTREVAEDAVNFEGFVMAVIEATCETVVDGFAVTENTPYAIYQCPATCVAQGYGGVWGTDIYTSDSNLCVAAVHAGAISDAEGGIVLVTWMPGQEEYPSSVRNGFETSSWDSWYSSFSVSPYDPSAGQP